MKKSSSKKTDSKAEKLTVVKAVLSGELIYSNKKEAFSLHQQSRFGESKEGRIYYSMPEALYLLEKSKLELTEGKKKISFDKLMGTAKKEDLRIQVKYAVFRDMRNRGYVVKTALKFGAEFRVYDKGIHPGQDHAKWVLFPVKEADTLTWHDFSAKNRVAHSTKKNLLIGIVDEERDVTYYEITWRKP